MATIATYRERTLGLTRFLELEAGKVKVTSHRWMISEARVSVDLSKCRPDTMFLRKRHSWFQSAAGAALVGVAIAIMGAYTSSGGTGIPVIVVGCAMALIGGGIAALTFRPIETIIFLNEHGQGILNVMRAGPDSGRFDDFVNLVQLEVRKFAPATNAASA